MTRLTKLVIANVFLKALDLLSTYLVVCVVGIEAEANPLVRALVDHLGVAAYFLLLAVFTGGMVLAHHKKIERALWLTLLLMLIIVINNTFNYLWVFYG